MMTLNKVHFLGMLTEPVHTVCSEVLESLSDVLKTLNHLPKEQKSQGRHSSAPHIIVDIADSKV